MRGSVVRRFCGRVVEYASVGFRTGGLNVIMLPLLDGY
jgi:hypothetical protein